MPGLHQEFSQGTKPLYHIQTGQSWHPFPDVVQYPDQSRQILFCDSSLDSHQTEGHAQRYRPGHQAYDSCFSDL